MAKTAASCSKKFHKYVYWVKMHNAGSGYLHVLEAYLQCKISIKHLRRAQNKIAAAAFSLTQVSMTAQEQLVELTAAR
jgi:hypothetical protein